MSGRNVALDLLYRSVLAPSAKTLRDTLEMTNINVRQVSVQTVYLLSACWSLAEARLSLL